LSAKDGHQSPLLASLQLGPGKSGDKETGNSRVKCDLRSTPSPARAGADSDGLDGVALSGFQEQLRDKLLSASLGGIGRKGVNDLSHSAPTASPSRSRVNISKADLARADSGKADPLKVDSHLDKPGSKGLAGMKKEIVEDFLRQLLQSGRAGKLSEPSEYDNLDKECVRPATMFSMAEHAREIGNKYLQERHFAAAAHCYEVACLLCPPTLPHALTAAALGPWAVPASSPVARSNVGLRTDPTVPGAGLRDEGRNACLRQLAAYHCNCALACLELGRYGDAINEAHAALVLNPQRSLVVKALYRLAIAHANLKNMFEARRCLKRLLELDPLNEYARALLQKMGDDGEAASCQHEAAGDARPLAWVDPPKRVQCLATAARDKAKGRKAKQRNANDDVPGGANGMDPRNGANGGKDPLAPGVRLDREAGLWHTLASYGNKLYILGGGPGEAHSASPAGATKDAGTAAGNGATVADAYVRGSDELHVLDVDTFEFRQLSGSKPPHPCHCHTATVVGTNMIVFGGCGPPLEQPPLVMVLDLVQGKWRVPPLSGIPPRQRQGHSANPVQGDRQLCIFGGIEPTGEQRVARVYNDAHLLDLQSFSWRKLEVAGQKPHARFGHTTTNLPGSPGRLLIVGGRDHLGFAADPALSSGFTGLNILDTDRRVWTQQSYSGTPPMQAFYHSACVIDDSSILFLGSGAAGSDGDFLPVHLLNVSTWQWSSPSISGIGPSPRIGHVAVSVGTRVYIYGGVAMREGQAIVDKSMYVLETGRSAPPVLTQVPQSLVQQSSTPRSGLTMASTTAASTGDVRESNGRDKAPKDDDFDKDMDDEPELSFEELLEQEKAYFKRQSEKTQFPRARDAKEKDLKKGRF